jgi:2-hydroxychromene-2-carboxylate isomerase
MTTSFTVTWDYRCPFARIGHQHVVAGLADGADWDVTYKPLSLGQMHVEEGQADVWDEPEKDSGILVLQAGTVVRDQFPDRFIDVHLALFDARHVESRDLREREVIADVLDSHGVPSAEVFEEIDSGAALEVVRKDHESLRAEADVWGVPTFVLGEQAVFVRLMHGPEGDNALGHRTVQRILDMLTDWPDLNEFKHTTLSR